MLILSRGGVSARRSAAARSGRLAAALAAGVFAAALVWRTEEAMAAGREALSLCARVLIPSLLPFFVLASLSVELGLAAKTAKLAQPFMRALFTLPGCCAAPLVLGLVGGYPVGARAASQLYERGECTADEARRLLRFCNNSGPAFIFGAAGAGVFESTGAGLLLFITHVLAALIVGFVFSLPRRKRAQTEIPKTRENTASPAFSEAFTGAVTGAAASLVGICGFVVFFAVALALLREAGLFSLVAHPVAALLSPLGAEGAAESIVTGFFELTSGVLALRGGASPLPARLGAAAFLLGWGGLSVHCQTASVLYVAGLSGKSCAAGKFLQGLIAAALTRLFFCIFPFISI